MEHIKPATILIGCTVGAGVLGLPYAIYESGFITGLLVLAFLGGIMLVVNLFFGEVILSTEKTHQLPGYAELYLGKWGKIIMDLAMVVGIYGALCAYLIGQGQVISELFGLQEHMAIFIFFMFGGLLIYTGLRAIDKAEGIFVFLIMMIGILIFVFSLSRINTNYLEGFNAAKIFIPYGIILFALNGLVAIPEMKEELLLNKNKLKKSIILGTLLPVVLYVLFSIAIIGTSADYFSPESAMANLVVGESMGNIAEFSLNIFTLLALTTSFMALGFGLKWQFLSDLKLSKNSAWMLAMLPPLCIAVLGLTTFTSALGFVGALCGGTQAILVVLMHRKAKERPQRKPEYSIKHHPLIGHTIIFCLIVGVIIGTFFV
ncbi:MAG: aromatic amino acid transport family protein [Nanobdellota archaeon]